MRRFSRTIAIAAPIVVTALALWLYLPSLGFGFMYDDPLDLPRATDRAWLDVLTSAGATMYYRPLPLVIWRVSYDLLGHNDGLVLHALIVALHAANGALVYAIGRRLYRDVAAGFVAGVLFVSFPFSYQAVMHTATTYHPLASFCVLGSVTLYLGWRDGGRRHLLPLSLLLAALAMLAHEYGVVVAALVAGVEALWLAEKKGKRPSPAVLAFCVLALGYLVLWASAPKWGQSLTVLGSARPNLAYFLQAIAFPVAGQLDRLPISLGASPATTVAATAIAIVLALAVLAWTGRRLSALALALFWAVIAFAPTLVLLAYSYVVDGPRLLYLSSAGICLAWAGALTAPFGWKRGSSLWTEVQDQEAAGVGLIPTTTAANDEPVASVGAPTFLQGRVAEPDSVTSAKAARLQPATLAPGLQSSDRRPASSARTRCEAARLRVCDIVGGGSSLLGLAIAALITLQGIAFVTARTPVFAAGADLVRQIVATATDGARPGRTYVNVPSWLALRPVDYPLGHSGTAVIPSYIGLGRVVYIVTGQQPEIASLTVESLKRDGSLYYEPHGPVASPDEIERAVRRGGGVYVARYGDGGAITDRASATQRGDERIALEYVGELRAGSAPVDRPAAAFGDWLRLATADVARSNGNLDITLRWIAVAQPARDETVFLHVYDGAGKLVAQTDGYALGNTFPLNRWRAGDEVVDVRRVALPAGKPAGEYRVAVGVYDRASGARAVATDATGVRFRDDAAIIATLTLP